MCLERVCWGLRQKFIEGSPTRFDHHCVINNKLNNCLFKWIFRWLDRDGNKMIYCLTRNLEWATHNIISIISILIVVLFCCLSQKLKGTVCKISSLDISQLQSTELCFIPLLIQLYNPSYLATVGQPTLAVIYGSKFRLITLIMRWVVEDTLNFSLGKCCCFWCC